MSYQPLGRVFQLWIPVRAAPLGRHVEHGPERGQVGRAARVLTRVARDHLLRPEMADRTVGADEDGRSPTIQSAVRAPGIVSGEGVGEGARELEVLPPPLALYRHQSL